MSLLKVVLYARVSTTDQTCENQLRELRDYCARRDWEIAELEKPATWKLHAYQAKQLRSKDAKGVNACKVCGLGEQHAMHTGHFGEYVDTGWSGSKASRPEFDRLMKDASLRNIDCVCVWKLDRFGRSVINMVEALKRLSSAGVRFIATTQNIDTDQASPTSNLILWILAAVAEFEREMIRERVKSGLETARNKGVRCGRPKLVFDRRKIVDLHRAGLSIRAIAAKLKLKRGMVHREIQSFQGVSKPPTEALG